MNIVKDPETGFYNTSHAGTTPAGPRHGFMSFATQHTHIIMQKYRDLGLSEMPIAIVFGVHPAFEIMANFSGMHMDMWGEVEMVGTIMDRDLEMVPCETIDLHVPAHAEIVVEGIVDLSTTHEIGGVNAPTWYFLPKEQKIPRVDLTAITMRRDKPIYRNHQTVPDTDHQPLPRLCHEAVLYNRISEMGLKVHDVRFPPWGAAVSCIIQVEYPRAGFVNGRADAHHGLALVQHQDGGRHQPRHPTSTIRARSTARWPHGWTRPRISSSCRPRGARSTSPPERWSPGHEPFRLVGKIGIDATAKAHRGIDDFQEAFPVNWGKVKLEDYLP